MLCYVMVNNHSMTYILFHREFKPSFGATDEYNRLRLKSYRRIGFHWFVQNIDNPITSSDNVKYWET